MSNPVLKCRRVADQQAQPWKNCGGVTTEIVVRPEGATFDSFDWRVSVARVESDGPFSNFPYMQRTLAVIEGEGLELVFEGGTRTTLSANSDPLDFAGDVPITARLKAGPIVDLNVMSHRDRFSHGLYRLGGVQSLSANPGMACVLVAAGGVTQVELTCATGPTRLELQAGDACWVDATDASYEVVVRSEANASCYAALVQILAISTGAGSPPPSLPRPTAV